MTRIGKAVPRRGGFFLVMVLVVIAVATLAAYSFTETMLAYNEASHLTGDHIQTRAAAESAIEMVRLILAQPADTRDSYGGLLDNAALFQAVTVVPPEVDGRPVNFSILAPGMDETGRLAGVRFGLRNESAKLNVNALIALDKNSELLMPAMSAMAGDTAGLAASLAGSLDGPSTEGEATELSLTQTLLMSLPGMTIEIADSILDWLDEDDEPRPYGAEREFYSVLPTPYAPKNGPIDSVEELLLVRGVTPELLFGVDANRNGVIDAAEQQMTMVDVNSMASLGWSAFLTVHALEANRRRDGTPRINVNQDDLEVLSEEISSAIENPDYATFVLAFRIGGQSTAEATLGGSSGSGPSSTGSNPSGSGSSPGTGSGSATGQSGGGGASASAASIWTADEADKLDLTGGGGTQLTQILDLIDATVTIENQTYRSPFTSDPIQMAAYMPLLMESLTTQDFDKMPGRININECPAELLYGIPLIDQETADAILEARAQPSESENRLYETWPLVEGLVSLETMKTLMPLITGGGDVYTAQIIGYHETTATATRLEVVLDGTGVNPKVIQYRDLSHLGRGFDLSVLGLRHSIPTAN
jgi:type II secretory pathway component PulK